MEKIIVTVAAGTVDHKELIALPTICAIPNFIFQAQGLLLFDEHLHLITEALYEFHDLKNTIILAGGHHGKNSLIGHFYIPKLEAMQWLVCNTQLMGAPYQYTSDVTEHCHCTCVLLWQALHILPSAQGIPQ